MNNACPECGAVYAVAEKDIGRRISCKKCNTALVVAEDGLTRDDDIAAPPTRKGDTTERLRHRDEEDDVPRQEEEDDDRPRRRRRGADEDDAEEKRPRRPKGPGMGEYLNKLKGVKVGGDLWTWLYGIGLFLTIYSFFAPQIDAAKVSSRRAHLIEAEIDDKADQRDVDNRNDGKPSEDDRKNREKRSKEYQKERPALEDKVRYAEASAQSAAWWNTMIRLLGFALLAFGSIGYLQSEINFRRVLGGVTVLLILLQVIGGGVGVALRAGGGG